MNTSTHLRNMFRQSSDIMVQRSTCTVNMPLVDVAMLVYNHRHFIAQAVSSVLEQRTTFGVRLVIADDCSTDGTSDILREFAAAYPDTIHLTIHRKNMGIIGRYSNVVYLQAQCLAKYIACIEGDDYWTDPFKLQKQVDLIESDPGATGCYSNAVVVDGDGNSVAEDYMKHFGKEPKDPTLADNIAPWGCSPSCTVLFKREILDNAPEWFNRSMRHSGFDLLIAMRGKYRYIDEKLGAYRVHKGGAWSSVSNTARIMSNLMFLKPMCADREMRARYGSRINRAIEDEINRLLAPTGGNSRFRAALGLMTFMLASPRDASATRLALYCILSELLGERRLAGIRRIFAGS